MPVLKPKSIKPARNIPYAEGILMYNGTGADIAANMLVRAFYGAVGASLQGGGLKMILANATNDESGGKVPVFVTKHAVPAGKWGVVLPWAILQNVNTAGVTAVGDAVYLQNVGTPGTWAAAKGTTHRAVGVCLEKHAAAGVVFLCPGKFNYGTD